MGRLADPESGFGAVCYMPTSEALAGGTEKAQIIKAMYGGKPEPVVAFRGTDIGTGQVVSASTSVTIN